MALQTDDFEARVHEAIGRYGAGRIATIIGTTSSGIQEAEHAYAQRRSETDGLDPSFNFEHSQSHFSVTAFVREYLGLRGPAYTVSTACSSSNKVFVDARQLITAGADGVFGSADDVVVATTTSNVYGYYSFGDVSPGRYQVQFSKPDGYAYTAYAAGTDPLHDSDAVPQTGRSDSFDV